MVLACVLGVQDLGVLPPFLTHFWHLLPLPSPPTEYLGRHPGGKEMLLLAAGRECTQLFASYHPFTDRPKQVIESFRIGQLTGPTEFPTFPKDTGFWDDMRTRVGNHLKGRDTKSPWRGLASSIPVMSLAVVCYLVITGWWGVSLPFWSKMLIAALFGVCNVLPMMHNMHDGSHTAMGPNETWWKVLGRGWLEVMAGGNCVSWQHQHVVGHHIYTNVFEIDPDLPATEAGDLRRLVPKQLYSWMYKYQNWYLPIVYGFLVMKIRLDDIKTNLFSKMNGSVRVNEYTNLPLRILGMKAIFLAHRVIVPLFFLKTLTPLEFFTLMFIGDYFSGIYLAYNFQVSHITTHVSWPRGGTEEERKTMEKVAAERKRKGLPSEDPYAVNMLTDSWAVTQVKTSLDYAHDSPITTYLSAALNYQIEHHLFPGISQYLYPEIAPIVQEVCRKHGVPYRYEKTFWAAWKQHVQFLWEMGQAGKAVHID